MGNPLTNTYVLPPLRTVTDNNSESISIVSNSEWWTIEEILESPEHIALTIPPEFGATSLLYVLANTMCSEKLKVAKVPLYLDIRNCKPYPANVIGQLKAAHPDSAHLTLGWKALEIEQPYIVLLDNFDPQIAEHFDVLKVISKIIPKARLVVAVRQPPFGDTSLGTSFEDIELIVRHVSIQPFRRHDIRKLVRRWQLPASMQESAVVEEIKSRFDRLNIPLTGPHISMFLMVLGKQAQYSPLNISTILEGFVEELLKKYHPQNIFRGAADYYERSKILELIAERMARENQTVVTTEWLYQTCSGYYSKIGLERDVMKIISEFVSAGILATIGTSITFRYSVVFSYFVALAMKSSGEFRNFIFTPDNIHQYVGETDIYCGLARNDLDALEQASRNYENLLGELQSELEIDLGAKVLEDIELPRSEKRLSHFIGAVKRDLSSTHDQDEKDDRLDEPTQLRTFEQTVRKRQIQNKLLKWVLALRVYSVCLKSLDGIEHSEKQKHLERILEGWAIAATGGVVLAALLFQADNVQFAGIKIRFTSKRRPSVEMVRRLLVAIPTFVSNFVRSDLGTPNLSKQLKGAEPNISLLADFFRTGLYSDMKLDAFLKLIRNYMHRVRSKNFLAEAFVVKVRDMYLRYGFEPAEAQELLQILANAQAQIDGVKKDKLNSQAAKISNLLRKRKLLMESKR